jgi:hypothetical protein
VGAIEDMLAQGFAIDADVGFGYTMLTLALRGNHLDAVQCLLRHGAQPDWRYARVEDVSAETFQALLQHLHDLKHLNSYDHNAMTVLLGV